MKIFNLGIFILFLSQLAFSQETLPNISLKDLSGNIIQVSELNNDANPIIINFWSTWCGPCKRELNSINEVYSEWNDETGVKIYAVSIDDQRTVDRVKPYVDANNWEFQVLLDTNGDLKRAMCVNSIPFTFLLDKDRKIVWKHNNYNPGDEIELYNKVVQLSKIKNEKD